MDVLRQVRFTTTRQAELADSAWGAEPLKADHLRGQTLCSLVSPGTELNAGFLADPVRQSRPGYARVMRVVAVGDEVTGWHVGDQFLAEGPHASAGDTPSSGAFRLPPGLDPSVALFARLMVVSMATLNTSATRPPGRVLVTGLGPVGNLAAQVFARCGYGVTAVDPVANRRSLAESHGLADVRPGVDESLVDEIDLHVECSGHEQAVLDGCRCVRRCGEVVLVGVPWRALTALTAFDVVKEVFHRYVVLRSGWEWQVPREPGAFEGHGRADNFAAAMGWLGEGAIRTDGLAEVYPPAEAQRVYAGLADQSLPTPTAIFDWR